MERTLRKVARTIAIAVLIAVVGACAATSPASLSPQPPTSAPPSIDVIRSHAPTEAPSADLGELVPYVNADLRYEVSVPRSWGEGIDRAGSDGVHDFGAGRGFATHDFPALSVSVGSTDGVVTLCQGVSHHCDAIVARDIDDLEASLVSKPEGLPGREATGDAVFAGHDARFKRPRYRDEQASHGAFGIGGRVMGDCLGCPGMLYHLYTLDDGRPVVISIDWWTLAFGELPSEDAGRILASFRFIAG